MDINLTSFIKNIAVVSIFLGCLGILISNISLEEFNIPVFESFDSRILLVGLIFVLFIVGHLLIYAMFYDYEELEKNNYFSIISILAIKLVFVTNLLVLICNGFSNKDLTVGLTDFWSKVVVILISVSLFGITIIGLGYQYIKNEKNKTFTWSLVISMISSVILFIYFLVKLPVAKNIFDFELYFVFLFGLALLFAVAEKKDRAKGNKVYTDSFFSKGLNSRNLFDKLFLSFYLIIMVFILTSKYTHDFYINLDKDWGGGRLENISVVSNNETIDGKLLLQTSNYLFIKRDSIVIKVDWDNIQYIKK